MTMKEKLIAFKGYGISYAKVAEMAGVNKSTVQKWMRGERETISPETENALQVGLVNILDGLNEIVYETTTSPYEYDPIVLD